MLEDYITGELIVIKQMLQTNESIFREMLISQAINNDNRIYAKCEKELRLAQKRMADIDHLITKLYEDNVNGKLSEHQFFHLMNEYDKEQMEIESKIKEFELSLNNERCTRKNIDLFIDNILSFDDYSVLTSAMVSCLIDKIIIHEASGRGNNRTQKIDIYYNYVGKITIPKIHFNEL